MSRLLLPLACAAGAIALGASELSPTFELRGFDDTVHGTLEPGDRHYYAQLVLAVFALAALAVAALTGSRPAAFAVAACGVAALALFAIIDLPDLNAQGSLLDPYFAEGKAVPVTGFWLELTGSLTLAATGLALALGGLNRDEE